MALKRLIDHFRGWFTPADRADHSPRVLRRGPQTHVIILDGTLSSLHPECRTHAGTLFELCREQGGALSLWYEPGPQWPTWREAGDVLTGSGISAQIRRAYGYLAARYRPGDRIYLFGYSRGAYAVRSLAGVIDRVGLLRPECATQRNVRTAYRHYECSPDSAAAQAFRSHHCHEAVTIDLVGVWDTVKALGIRLPFLWKKSERKHAFHNPHLSPSVKNGLHAVALDESRQAYAPVMWTCDDEFEGRAEQVWFRGTHADIGGQLNGFEAARPLANIPLVWMLERATHHGLALPEGWQQRFPMDVNAPSVGGWRGWAKFFLARRRRVPLQDRSERLHETVGAVEDGGAKGALPPPLRGSPGVLSKRRS